MSSGHIREAKQGVRERVWSLLDRERVAPGGGSGRIPAFEGAEAAASHLDELDFWRAAGVVKTVPDRAQLPVRAKALEQNKRVYMASPRLASELPFFLLDPYDLGAPPRDIAERHVAVRHGRPVDLSGMLPVDVVVCGSVAVNRQGVRLGKGAGYSDIEIALLQEAGLIDAKTPIVTTVHELQVIDEELPEDAHDFRVDFIVTPERVIECPPSRRPSGVLWESLDDQMVDAIPALAKRRA